MPEFVSHIHRDRLEPQVRKYADNLREQIYVVWRKVGARDVHEFDQLLRDKKVSIKDAERVRELYRQLTVAVEKNVAPRAPTVRVTTQDQTFDGQKFEREIVVDFAERLNFWRDFFTSHGLPELAKGLPESFELTDYQIATIKDKLLEGFEGVMILPDPNLLRIHCRKLLGAMTQGYMRQGIYTDNGNLRTAIEAPPGDIREMVFSETPTREEARDFSSGKPYIFMYRNDREPPDWTIGKSAFHIYEQFIAAGNSGFTLEEYLIFQRSFREENSAYADTAYTTWLLGSSITEDGKQRWLEAGWNSQAGRLELHCAPIYSVHDIRGARDAFVMEIG